MLELVEGRRGLLTGGLMPSPVPILYPHVVSAGELDPVTDVISDYVFVHNGTGSLPVPEFLWLRRVWRR